MERLFPFCRLILCLNDGVISVHKMFSSMRYLLLTVVLLSTLLGSCLKEFFFLCYKFKHTTYFVFYQIHGNRSYTELRSWIYPELSFVWGDRQWIYSFLLLLFYILLFNFTSIICWRHQCFSSLYFSLVCKLSGVVRCEELW